MAIVCVLAAVTIPRYQKYRENQKAIEINAVFVSAQQTACGYYGRIGSWPCSSGDLNAPDLIVKVEEMHGNLECNCQTNTITLIYSQDGKSHYKQFNHNSGKTMEGVL